MKNRPLLALVSVLIMFSSCTSAYYANTSNQDELYGGGDATPLPPRSSVQKSTVKQYQNSYTEAPQDVYITELDMENYTPGAFAEALNSDNTQSQSYENSNENNSDNHNDNVNINVTISPSWAMGSWGGWGYSPSWTIYSSWYNPWYSSWNSPWYNPWYGSWYNPWYSPWYGSYHHHHHHHNHYPTYYSAGYGSKWNRPYYGGNTRYNRGSKGHSYERMYNSGVKNANGRRTETMMGSTSGSTGSKYFDSNNRVINNRVTTSTSSSSNNNVTGSTTGRSSYTRSAKRPNNTDNLNTVTKKPTTFNRNSNTRGSSSSFNRGSSSSSFNRSSSSSFNRGSSSGGSGGARTGGGRR